MILNRSFRDRLEDSLEQMNQTCWFPDLSPHLSESLTDDTELVTSDHFVRYHDVWSEHQQRRREWYLNRWRNRCCRRTERPSDAISVFGAMLLRIIRFLTYPLRLVTSSSTFFFRNSWPMTLRQLPTNSGWTDSNNGLQEHVETTLPDLVKVMHRSPHRMSLKTNSIATSNLFAWLWETVWGLITAPGRLVSLLARILLQTVARHTTTTSQLVSAEKTDADRFPVHSANLQEDLTSKDCSLTGVSSRHGHGCHMSEKRPEASSWPTKWPIAQTLLLLLLILAGLLSKYDMLVPPVLHLDRDAGVNFIDKSGVHASLFLGNDARSRSANQQQYFHYYGDGMVWASEDRLIAIKLLYSMGFDVIYTSSSFGPDGVIAMREWYLDHIHLTNVTSSLLLENLSESGLVEQLCQRDYLMQSVVVLEYSCRQQLELKDRSTPHAYRAEKSEHHRVPIERCAICQTQRYHDIASCLSRPHL